MQRDRSLEEFAGKDAEEREEHVDESASNAEGSADPEDAAADTDAVAVADAVAPADPTYSVSPDGATCAACGETVTRRWRDDGDYVCVDCKEW